MERRHRFAILLMALSSAVAVGLFLFLDRPSPPKWLAEWPELADADPAICERICAAWPAAEDGNFGTPKRDRLEPVLDAAGPGAGLALLRVIRERDGGPVLSLATRLLVAQKDADWWPGLWLAERDDASLDPILLRFLRDRDRGEIARRFALVGLLRPGCSVREEVVDLLVGPELDPSLKKEILSRADRLGAPLPERFRELLYLPWRGFDASAAAVLSVLGESDAPSLVLDGLRRRQVTNLDRPLLVRAVRAITGAAPELEPLVSRGLTKTHMLDRDDGLADAFADWLSRHPGRLDTPFEGERRAWRESDRRARELSLRSFEDVLAADPDDFDFASAALLFDDPEHSPWTREEVLESLDRFCLLLRRDLEGVEGREAVLAVFARRFYTGWFYLQGPYDLPTGLARVFDQRAACCAGYASLYVAVAERLDLPIVAVGAPEHVFLRWIDADGARNIEPTERGAEHPDEWYRSGRGDRLAIAPAAEESGVYLAPLTKRQLLARVVGNFCFREWLDPRARRELADRAVRLDPRGVEALLTRAHLEPDEERKLADIETALKLDPSRPSALLAAGQCLGRLGRVEEAVANLERAGSLAPDDPEMAVARARALLDVGRSDESLAILDSVVGRISEWPAARFERMRARILAGRDDWREDLEKIAPSPEARPDLHLDAAEFLLEDNAFRAPDPVAAGDLLAELSFLAGEPGSGPGGHLRVGPDHEIVPRNWRPGWRGLKERRAALLERIRELTGR